MSIVVEGPRAVYFGCQARFIEDSRELAWAEQHIVDNPMMSYILGKYVEADNANDNGHIFPYAELATAQRYIAHSPLNMLHEANHVVGCFIASEMVYPTEGMTAAAADVPGYTGPKPFVEALSAFWRYYNPDEYVAAQKAYRNGALFYCVDDDTELLTEDGWRRQDSIDAGTVILTLNPHTGLSEWLPAEAVHRFSAVNTEMVRMEGMMHSSLTTPGHRWLVDRVVHRNEGGRRSREWVEREWRTTETLTRACWIPTARQHGQFPALPKLSDELVELVAWFWTEGTDPGVGGVVMYQSHVANPIKATRITAALTALFGSPGRVRDGGLWYATQHGRMTHFHLCKAAADLLRSEAPNKVPSGQFLRSLTYAQLQLFIRISLDGDGTTAKADGQISINQVDEEGIRAFEMACALAGLPTNTVRIVNKHGHQMWRCCVVRRSDRVNPVDAAKRDQGFVIERETYTGTVWCPQTVNGTFLARRQGTVWWTGNSMESVPAELTCRAVGCGARFKYDGRYSTTYCAHLNEPAAQRELHQPVFTGGALIIPPVRPGWKKADISEISHLIAREPEMAASLYEQFKNEAPHLDPKHWESAMALMLRLVAKEKA